MVFLPYILVSISIVVITINVVSGQHPGDGLCFEGITIQQDFKLDEYVGTWFEYEKYPHVATAGKKCISANYTKKDDDTVEILYSGESYTTGKAFKVAGEAKVIESGAWSMHFRGEVPKTPNYIVLSTDYTNYAVVYSCKQLTDLINIRIVWILTRERFPSKDVIEVAHKVFDDNNIPKMPLSRIHQNNCVNGYEEMDLTSSVVDILYFGL